MGVVCSKGGKRCYFYLQVSTLMQVDGYSLEAQKDWPKKRADYEGMIIAGIYCDGPVKIGLNQKHPTARGTLV